MDIETKKLLYTFINFILLIFTDYKINTHKTLHITSSYYIHDYIIGLFFISFIIYCIIYFINILLKKNANTNKIMSVWNQINTNGSLFVIISILYFKIMPFKIITIILLILLIIIYYPLIEYINNYILNENYKPNTNDLLKAINYSEQGIYDINTVSKMKYYIGLNKSDSSEIIINFKGTDINEIEDIKSNLKLGITQYTTKYATNPDIIKELTNPVGIHIGYFNLYLSVREILYNKCKELLDNGAKKIFISGYSLGAGVSTLCTFDFHANLNKLNITTDNINSVHIAGPSVGDYNFVNLYNNYIVNTVRLEHINDPVPRLTSWIYVHTKNQYLLSSNIYSIDAHMLHVYRDCVINNITMYNYISGTILTYTIIFLYLLYIIRKFYIQQFEDSRYFINNSLF